MQAYVLALGETRATLGRSQQYIGRETVLAAVVLDIVEKILSTSPHPPSTHIDGAMSLVKMIGLSQSQKSPDFPVLLSLTNQSMIASLASQEPIHPDIVTWRTTLEQSLRSDEHPTGMTALFVRYAELQHLFATNRIAGNVYARECFSLDAEMAMLELAMPPFWRHRLIELDKASHDQFGQHGHVYTHRNICQARNLQRVCRLLLNEAVIQHASPPHMINCNGPSIKDKAHANINHLATEICMSVAAFADCRTYRTQQAQLQAHMSSSTPRLLDSRTCQNQSHTPTHTGDCYTLIFPLYAAARSNMPSHTRHLIIGHLQHIADHFRIRNAMKVSQVLQHGQPPGVWDMYARLGSYAFHM